MLDLICDGGVGAGIDIDDDDDESDDDDDDDEEEEADEDYVEVEFVGTMKCSRLLVCKCFVMERRVRTKKCDFLKSRGCRILCQHAGGTLFLTYTNKREGGKSSKIRNSC